MIIFDDAYFHLRILLLSSPMGIMYGMLNRNTETTELQLFSTIDIILNYENYFTFIFVKKKVEAAFKFLM